MKVLLIKMSSLGDVVHTLPAIQAIQQAVPNIEIDWVIEEAFMEIAQLAGVNQLIPIRLRAWRKNKLIAWRNDEVREFLQKIREKKYDKIIDAQGLLKSAVVAFLAKGPREGYDGKSAREALASFFYNRRHSVPNNKHAILRTFSLFEKVFELKLGRTETQGDSRKIQKQVIFLHGTTWHTKLWPVTYWGILAKRFVGAGFQVLLPWGNRAEHERALAIKSLESKVTVLPKMTLQELAVSIQQSKLVVSVDTGLAHLAAYLKVPSVSIYGPTNPKHTGTFGVNQKHLQTPLACAPCKKGRCLIQKEQREETPCMLAIKPETIWAHCYEEFVQ